jgi:hypothetical protein
MEPCGPLPNSEDPTTTLLPTMNLMNPVYTLLPYFFKIRFNRILLSKPRYLLLRFLTEILNLYWDAEATVFPVSLLCIKWLTQSYSNRVSRSKQIQFYSDLSDMNFIHFNCIILFPIFLSGGCGLSFQCNSPIMKLCCFYMRIFYILYKILVFKCFTSSFAAKK